MRRAYSYLSSWEGANLRRSEWPRVSSGAIRLSSRSRGVVCALKHVAVIYDNHNTGTKANRFAGGHCTGGGRSR